jgi:tetratricopeptide (TPR) repeat protein
MTDNLGAWLRGHRQAHSWTNRDMARRIIDAGQTAGDKSMPSLDTMCRNVRRWERGHGSITERYKLHYGRALGIPPAQFGTAPAVPGTGTGVPGATLTPAVPLVATQVGRPAQVVSTMHVLMNPRLEEPLTLGYRGGQEPGMGDSTVEREVLMAAHEGSDHAERAEEHGIGEATFEQLRADVVRLAHLTGAGAPFDVFLDMRRVRDRIYRLLDRRLWPREQTDLYFLLGCLNGLMAIPANQLGYPDAAEELNRAGFAYANAIDHRPLMANLRGELSVYAYYRGRFEESRDLALSGLRYLSVGQTGAGLHIYHARAAGRLGDADVARQAVRDAHEARDRDYSDELLEIGGNYAISEATYHGQAGSAFTVTPGGEREASEELEHAVSLYDEGPRPGEDHWFGGKPLAGIDLAMVRLRSGALDAATAALEPALSLPAAQRISDMTIRLAAVRDELAAPIFHGSPQARDLGDRIEEFDREAVTAGLRSLSG